jgi:hypothetical protein
MKNRTQQDLARATAEAHAAVAERKKAVDAAQREHDEAKAAFDEAVRDEREAQDERRRDPASVAKSTISTCMATTQRLKVRLDAARAELARAAEAHGAAERRAAHYGTQPPPAAA